MATTKHTFQGTGTPAIVAYATGVPDEPFIPAIPWIPSYIPDVTITWPPVAPAPSTTDQEIGALKHRVGLLEQQMRELVEKFKRRGKR